MQPFRVTDDSNLNSFGFRILVSGIDTSGFLVNPIMLHEHDSDRLPTGTWKDLIKGNNDITAIPEFDENDPFAVTIKNKVEKNIIKMASIGVEPIEWSNDAQYKLPGQQLPTLIKSKLKEISTCTFGSDMNAIKLIDSTGKVLTLNKKVFDNYIKQSVNYNNNNLSIMENQTIIQLKAAIGISDKTDAEMLAMVIKNNNEVVTLKAANDTLTAENAALKTASENSKKEVVLQKAVDEKKITLKEKEVYLKLSIEDIKAVVDTKKAATDFKSMTEEGNKEVEGLLKLSWKELDKQGKLVQLKESNIEVFKSKFKEEFKKEYKD